MNADIGVIRGEDVPRPGGGHTTKGILVDDRDGGDMLKVMNEVARRVSFGSGVEPQKHPYK